MKALASAMNARFLATSQTRRFDSKGSGGSCEHVLTSSQSLLLAPYNTAMWSARIWVFALLLSLLVCGVIAQEDLYKVLGRESESDRVTDEESATEAGINMTRSQEVGIRFGYQEGLSGGRWMGGDLGDG